MTADALRFDAVTKRYSRSDRPALDGFSCRFPSGAICGLVGPNGAGKTTAFSVVSGFLRIEAGSVEILGENGFDPWRLKGRLGVLPQDAELSDRHTPWELITHLGRLQGLSGREAREEGARVIDVVRLTDRRNDRIGRLSHGMRRRVAVASALVGRPDLVLLDEPTAGLDPVQARSLRQALEELRGIQTLVVSSHNLDELERLCDWVVMMDQGRCIAQGPLDELTGQTSRVIWTLGDGAVPIEALADALPDQRFVLEGRLLTQLAPSPEELDSGSIRVMAALSEAGIPVREVQRGVGLERRFFQEAGEP